MRGCHEVDMMGPRFHFHFMSVLTLAHPHVVRQELALNNRASLGGDWAVSL